MIVYNNFNQGRLGNQMFFVASTIGISIKNNTTYGFTSQMGYNNIDYQNIFENSLPITKEIPVEKYYQNGFSYYDIDIDNVELIGYFQSEKFFKHCENIIRNQFKFKKKYVDKVLMEYPNITNSLSIHVRRGDYINQQNYHPLIPLNYYYNIINDISYEYENIYVFSDDIIWVKENFLGNKYVFPYCNDELLSFILLSFSKDIIISNSTYSWWASWINSNPNKKIFCPHHKNWFGINYLHLDTKDIIPDNWIQIEYT